MCLFKPKLTLMNSNDSYISLSIPEPVLKETLKLRNPFTGLQIVSMISRTNRWIDFSRFLLIFLMVTDTVNSLKLFPESEYAALYDLFNATNGIEWTWSDSVGAGVPWVFTGTATANPCAEHWQGVKCPVTTSNTNHVSKLQLDSSNLRGYLPASLSNLVDLQVLSLAANKLVGTIPSEFCSFAQLQDLVLDENTLHGPIPSCIGNLTSLQDLVLNRNRLTGTIPSALGGLSNLAHLDLAFNWLHGRIPDALCKLSQLVELSLPYNRLTGPIPPTLGNLTQLQDLLLEENAFTGPIPPSIATLTRLVKLALQNNQLSGYIMPNIGNLFHLQWLFLYGNSLSGPVPHSFGNLTSLLGVSLEGNILTGQIPSSIGQLIHLLGFSVHNNDMTGPIPDALGNLTSLFGLNLHRNRLTGTIPSSVGNLVHMIEFYIERNELTGTIPDSIGNMNKVVGFSAEVNYLTGTIPDTISNMTELLELSLYDNQLTGTLPQSIGLLKNLFTLSLEGNNLNGPLSDRFRTSQKNLQTIQLDNSQFTGTLPTELFALPSLASFSMVGSCLLGTMPDNICNATNLEALILYGLTTGASCRARGVRGLSRSQRHTFRGAFPSCLLQLPLLSTLLLSSNGLTGSIPGDVIVSARLFELDLGHNDLSGSIPNNIQNHSWALLDLSNNKFSGVLQPDLLRPINVSFHQQNQYVFNASLGLNLHSDISLSSNRLSGPLPSSLRPLQSNLSVLAGNLFECKYDKSNLPQHDSDISNYECASNTFNVAIFAWLALFAGGTLLLFGAFRNQLKPLMMSLIQLPDEFSSKLTHLFSLLEEYHVLVSTAWCATAYCMAALLPFYAVVSYLAGTHTYQYAYVLSAIYISGVVPFVVHLLLLVFLLLIVYAGVVTRHKAGAGTGSTTTDMTKNASSQDVAWRRAIVWIMFSVSNTTVVLGANIAFVYVVLYQSSAVQTLAQIFLSLFKLSWSMVASPYMIRQLASYFLPPQTNGPPEPFFTLQLLVSLFNNIAIPCLVVAAIDPNCFSKILLPPDSQTVTYLAPRCVPFIREGVCEVVKPQRYTLQFTPPFTYSYQCSASFITSYAPTFVYMSISTVFLSPLLQYVLMWMHDNYPTGSKLKYFATLVLPGILALPTADLPPVALGRKMYILGGVGTLVTLLTQLGILLTFGVIFPPVALAMAVSLSSVVVMVVYKVRRFLLCAISSGFFSYLDVINAECEGLGSAGQMHVAQVMLLCYCCAFYALFLFDTLGDAVGFDNAFWVLIVLPLLPLAMYGITEAFRLHHRDRESSCSLPSRSNVIVEVPEIELKPFSAQEESTTGKIQESDQGDDVDFGASTVNIIHVSCV